MSKSVLLSVDLSNPALSRKEVAEVLALFPSDGVLHVVSVMPRVGSAQITSFLGDNFERDALRGFGDALKAWVAENVPPHIDVRPHVLHGTIYDEILKAADKLDVDLIVIGAHRPELSDYLLGPNAARVVRHAKQSVYVVRSS